jgi:DNA-binding NtrC family response regulator
MVTDGFSFAPEVIAAFKAYKWGGNVRELENLIKNALAYSTEKILTLNDFPHFAELKSTPDECRVCIATRFHVLPGYKEADLEFKRAYFSEILKRADHRVSQAATMAGLTSQGLRKILKSLQIELK